MGRIEIHPRTFSQRFGETPNAQRTFIETPDVATFEPLPGIGSEHPEYAALKAVSVAKTTGYNGDPDQIQYVISYSPAPTCEQEPNPLDRCDRWTVGTSGSQVPATTWLDNGVEKPLINSAGDPIGGYNKRRLEMRLTVSGNRASSQIATAKAVVNATNSAGWGGGAPRSWLCSGATARERTELVGTLVVNFWEVSFDFLYNEELWSLSVPDVGLNYLNGGVKKRAYVEDSDGNFVPSPKPVALNADGSLRSGDPLILQRPVYREIEFSTYFGDPPT